MPRGVPGVASVLLSLPRTLAVSRSAATTTTITTTTTTTNNNNKNNACFNAAFSTFVFSFSSVRYSDPWLLLLLLCGLIPQLYRNAERGGRPAVPECPRPGHALLAPSRLQGTLMPQKLPAQLTESPPPVDPCRILTLHGRLSVSAKAWLRKERARMANCGEFQRAYAT
ncbi:hypothetical protein E2C01_021039 [Portunus trituberculatus]|uniref:Secreted protein n=1 Tax=Portunus trituberculatus TaxID=210409 RepID=A0A5B7E1G5_PORTR|nr:hypothetical protein [Portunus trituberculatus]